VTEKVKCHICAAAQDDKCQLMRVVVEDNGKKTYYCCERPAEAKNKRI
jgi:hypothetical protein